MGWMETCAVDERMRFVMAIEGQEEAFAAVCRRFGVSRKTGYKWLGRYREAGVQGLTDWSRAPLNHPQAVAQEILTKDACGNSDASSSRIRKVPFMAQVRGRQRGWQGRM